MDGNEKKSVSHCTCLCTDTTGVRPYHHMDDLYNLELLSLVAKITQEIDNHAGINEKTLAEFVISLHDQSKTLPAFKDKLKEVGADFPDSFVENVDRFDLLGISKLEKFICLQAYSEYAP